MTPDETPELLRQAEERGLGGQAEALLEELRQALEHALAWHKRAGRALASEGLATDVFREQIHRWIEREKEAIREKLRRLLAS
jgi:hypothetical protein